MPAELRSLPAELERFLGDIVAGPDGNVERFETHGAVVLVGPRETLKIKRPVCYSYMDFSTLEQRRRACVREIEVNAIHAPQIYLGVAAVTRRADGGLELDGTGEPVEWVVRMRSFAQSAVLSNMILQGPLQPALAKALGEMAASYHRLAEPALAHDSAGQLAAIITDLDAAFAAHAAVFSDAQRARWRAGIDERLQAASGLLSRRARSGHVRRVHGDLHLGNIVLWEGWPVAFDAIEFDENLATIDTLYDLAFLLMDLDGHGARDSANVVLNRYLWCRQSDDDLDGLALLPLFLSLRAGVRAMVGAQRGDLMDGSARRRDGDIAARYLKRACGYLDAERPVLVVIGGFSGTGKSTLAAALAPMLGAAPGAIHLRSDLERKSLLGVGETDRLGQEGYAPGVSARVYDRMLAKARRSISAGHSVVLDAVYAGKDERDAACGLAHALGVPFAGYWLEAPARALEERVSKRVGDASDATAEVVATQLRQGAGAVDWRRVDASGELGGSLQQVREALEASQLLKKSVEKA